MNGKDERKSMKNVDFSDMPKEKMMALVNQIGVGFIIVIAVILGVTAWFHVNKVQQTINDNDKALIELQASLNKMNKEPVLEAEDVNKAYKSAAKLGQEVADKQNKYPEAMNDKENLQDNIKKLSEELSKYFGKSIDDQLGRTPWYITENEGVSPKWQFLSNYAFTEHTLPVIWLCKDADRVLAYATAEYNSDKNVFTNVKVTMTGFGMASQKPTENTWQSKEELLKSAIESIRRVTKNSDKTKPIETDANGKLKETKVKESKPTVTDKETNSANSTENTELTDENKEYNEHSQDIMSARMKNKENHRGDKDE